MKRWLLTIEVLEDLHIGTGTGRGDIDAVQVRDRRGWPVLPASHIKGVLRETAAEWARMDPEIMPQERIDCIFGRQGAGQGRLQLTSAYLDQQRDPLLWGSTRIDASTGSAQEGALRFVEYIPAGARFKMQAALAPGSEDEDVALLRAIIGRCRQLGSGRNRGHGRVRWRLEESPSATSPALAPPASYPARLRLVLRNCDSLCLARTGHPGNLIATDAFIRGRSLRGAATAACLALGHTDWARVLLDPALAWGDGLPLPPREEAFAQNELLSLEVLPIPLSIGTPKAMAPPGRIPWWARPGGIDPTLGARREVDLSILDVGERLAEKMKRPGTDEFLFRPAPGKSWQRYRPQIIERLHTRVPSEENQREQALFSTEEIAENTTFVSDLIVTNTAQAQTLGSVLQALTGQWLRCGRGGRPLIIEHALWLAMPARAAPVGSDFTLLLESDLIVRDSYGNFHDRLDATTVAMLAGFEHAELVEKRNFSEGITLFGFNAATGLPRMAQRAIKAGSVIRVGGPDAAKVREALALRCALGECPDEGFGRFRIDGLPVPVSPDAPEETPTVSPGHDEALCRQARDWAQKLAKAASAPSASQWGDFRGRVLAARLPEQIDEVFQLIEDASQKHGGKAWKPFVEASAELRKAVQDVPLADAQRLLDYFVRWVRARASDNGRREDAK